MTMTKFSKIAFVSGETAEAEQAVAELKARYEHSSIEDADVIVALGGDGERERLH